MRKSRRDVLKFGVAAGIAYPLVLPGMGGSSRRSLIESDIGIYPEEGDIKKITSSAINAAISAGATYADVRLTFTQEINFSAFSLPGRDETMELGVRALVGGFWGFAAGGAWDQDTAARLGKAACINAKANVLGGVREIELAPCTPESGQWTMPIKDDPFKMPYEEVQDFLNGLILYIRGLRYVPADAPKVGVDAVRQRKIFANSVDQFTNQLIYRTTGDVSFGILKERRRMGTRLDTLSPAGKGFEHIRDQPLRDQIRKAHSELLEDFELEVKLVDPGRYNVLMPSSFLGGTLSGTIGEATQVDRAFGYEANATGTSYITDPKSMLMTFKVGSNLLNVSCERSQAGTVGHIKWDDEGVQPASFELVKDGILVNMQTNREGAGWIKDHYTSRDKPFVSFGCSSSESALVSPLIQSANLSLHHSDSAETLDTMRQNMEDGLEVKWGGVSMDFQCVTGYGPCVPYEIKKGKRTALLVNAGMLFRTQELWNNLLALGGKDSVRSFGISARKGEPSFINHYSVSTPVGLFKEMTFIDITRKA